MKKFFKRLVWVEERVYFGFAEKKIKFNPIFGTITAFTIGGIISWILFF